MAMNPPNPYSSPMMNPSLHAPTIADPAVIAKAETIIKDAGQFWLAIILCILCSALGALIIGPWYLVRLSQWNALAKSHPMLMAQNVPHGSLAQRFQAAKLKLMIGAGFGGLVLSVVALSLVVIAVSS
jgi:hypothetical protein